MKSISITLTILAAFASFAAFAWATAPVKSHPDAAEAATEKSRADAHNRMVAKQSRIAERVGMSAPMELPEEGEEDFVKLAEAQGWIIEVTLEKVEAAIKAAAATPSVEDDIAAKILAHWGSYRFYLDEKPASPKPNPSR